MKDTRLLYMENCKTQQREITQDLHKLRDTPCSNMENYKIEMPILPKLTYRLNTIPFRILIYFFKKEINKMILKSIWNYKGTRIAKTIWKRIKLENLCCARQ